MKKEIFVDLINKLDSTLDNKEIKLSLDEKQIIEDCIENLMYLVANLEKTST